jgi:hypothetical protein
MNINLYDKDLNRIAIIGGQYISCLWSEGYNTVESFTLELIATDEYKKKVRPDCYVGRSDRPSMMVIKTVQIKNGKIVATGKQASRVLSDVSFIGTINSGSMVDESIKNAYNGSGKYRCLDFAETDLQVRYDHQISNKSILELCEKMCQSTDLGFKTIRQNRRLVTMFYQPQINPNLIFSERFGNMSIDSLTISVENMKNYAVVLGQGEGENRVRVDVDQTNGSDRRSTIVDANDIQQEESETDEQYNARLVARGIENLLEQTRTFKCAFTPYAKDFGTKYDLGDILTVYMNDYGITLCARVAKFSQKSQKNKTTTTIEVGEITIMR